MVEKNYNLLKKKQFLQRKQNWPKFFSSEIKFQKIVLGILPNSECKNVERITFRM